MRLLSRVLDGTGAPLDLHLELADDVTVGELADHLARCLGAGPGLTLAAERVLDRSARVAEVGPRSGRTVTLVTADPCGTPDLPRSPVSLHGPRGEPLALRYGRNVVDDAAIEVSEQITVTALPGSSVPTVNGARPLAAARLAPGDLLHTGAQLLEVRCDGVLRPPSSAGPAEPVRRSPAVRGRHEPHPVELPDPPGPTRLPGFPVLSAVVPLLMGVALWVTTRSAASLVFVGFSFVFVVASGIEARRESRAETRFREEEFRSELADRVTTIDARRASERTRAEQEFPPLAALVEQIRGRGERLWERSGLEPNAEHLRVRLGTANQLAADRAVVPAGGRRDLRDELRSVAERLERHDLPATVDLTRTRGLAVVGTGEAPTALARAVVLQLAALVGPDELGIEALTGPERSDPWHWVHWLPHAAAASRAPSRLLVVDGAHDDAVRERLHGSAGDTVAVVVSPTAAGLPAGIRAILHSGGSIGGGRLELLDDHGAIQTVLHDVTVEDLTVDECDPLARSLAPLVPVGRIHLDGDPATPPSLPPAGSLLEVWGDPFGGTARRWERGADAATLAAPIGRVEHGPLIVDLRLDGPHALVAGTTGSGKSELLRTLVASLAAHHAPDRLTFLLVDYKGGAAFGALSTLPHTVGLITDLNEALARRALRSLRAEVRRREVLLAEHGATDLAELDRSGVVGRPPALVVVVDEFAALARELPEFVDGLVDLAQRGRSLGVHLVLATQRPAGVVTDAIRANMTLRVALRVADEDDSRDVVDAPSAAHLPRDLPGRAVIRVGPNRSTAAQIAWSGGSVRRAERIRSRPLGAPEPAEAVQGDAGPTELDTIVAELRRAAEQVGVPVPRRPWLDPLPELVTLDELGAPGGPNAIPLGWVDLPDQQRRDVLELDLDRDGGLLVLGSSRSGRSSALRTLAASLDRCAAPERRPVVHAIDTGNGLGDLVDAGWVDDVVPADDAERVLRLLRVTDGVVRRRLAAPAAVDGGFRRHVLLIDGFATFEELLERINRGEAIDRITQLARDGRAVGVHVAVTARRRSEVPASLVSSLGCHLHLRCTEDDAVLAGAPPEAADPEAPPGRGFVGADPVQIALAVPSTRDVIRPREPVPTLPRRVRVDELATSSDVDPGAPWLLPIGLDADVLNVARLDLTHHHALVAGPPRSGVSSALALLGTTVDAHVSIGPRGGDWQPALDEAMRHAEQGRRTVLLVDDLPQLLDGSDGDALEQRLLEVMDRLDELPLRLVAGGEVDALTRCYSSVVTRLRTGRTGLLLCPDPDLHAGLLHAELVARAELPACPGRGWVVAPGQATPLQVALL